MKNNECKIVLFSDLHYAPERPVNNGSIIGRKLTDLALPLLEKLIQKINNEIKPDIVFSLGDFIEDFNDKEKDLENLDFIWKKLSEIKTPFYSAVGNHDLRSMDARFEVEKIFNGGGYNKSTFSLNFNGYHFVILSTDIDPDKGREFGGILKVNFISKKEIEWLKNDLKTNKLPCIIFTHFGIAEDEMKGNWWFEKNPSHGLLGNRNELKEILKQDKNLIAVFSGHQHWTKHYIEDGISYFVLGSLSENMLDDGIPDGVFYEINLSGKNISILEKRIRI